MAPQSSSILTISGGFVADSECLRTICDHDEDDGEGEGARVVRVVSLRVAVEATVRVRVWVRFMEGLGMCLV